MKRLFAKTIQFLKETDLFLVFLCACATAWGLMMLYGISNSGFIRARVFWIQAVAFAIGIAACICVSLIDYRTLAGLWRIYVPATVIPVLLTYVIGIQRDVHIDDKAWLKIPFVGVTFQPSELLKLAFILFFALHLERDRERMARIPVLLVLCFHALMPVLMVVLQGDDGTAMVFVAIFCCMVFAAGIRLRFVAAALAAVAAASPLVWIFFMDDHQRSRAINIIDPASDPAGVGWQQAQGLVGIGSGQMWGKGMFGSGYQYVPEMHNDFIYAVLGETTGFVGSVLAIALLSVICLKILQAAYRAKDPLGRNICVGVFAMIAFQAAWNIGMCLSILPVAGLTLPFFSAGGTSLVLCFAGIGLVLSVSRHNKTGMFD
jgi:rod shape determining protein RodA